MNGQIFISYRRDDSSAWARLVYTSLFQHFSQNRIFMDVDNLDPGVNFFEAIDASVGSCDVLIAVIGKSWLIASDEEGRHRLDNPDDLVRREIATALKRDIRVIPVLVDGALMPRASELPDDLRLMVSRNALEVSHSRFNADLARLITALERLFEKADAERKQRAEDELSEHRLQPHPPIPVAIVAPSTPSAKPEVDKTFVKTPKMVYPLPSKPTKPEPVKPSASWSGGTGGKGGSKQIVAFLAIAAALILGGLIYLAIRASHWPMSQPAKITASAPNPPVIATPTIEEKAPTKPEMAVKPPRQVPVVIPSASISATPLQAEVTSNTLEKATKDHPWTNSLGMRFVPVAGTHVLFSIWDTRVQDFEAFVKNTNYGATNSMYALVYKDRWQQRGATWKEPGFSQGATHPVVGVNWNDAEEFCKWLTVLERNAGDLPRNAEYRLPKDEEWSVAVRLKDEVGSTPDEKSGKIWLYPWEISQKRDKSWPPPTGAGNYAGEEAKIENLPSDFQVEVIEGYNDGFPRTSPVGSFQANLFGLYDMGGNVWQWCEDWYNDATQKRVLRGAGWYTSRPVSLLASHRAIGFPSVRHDDYGFRCVVAVESSTPMVEENGSRSSEAASPPPQPSPSSPPLQTPTEPAALERVKSKGIADYFRALPPQEFTKSAPSDLLRIIRSGKGKSRLDSRNGFMFLEGEGEQVSLRIALFLDANRLPLLAIAWGKLHQPDFTHLSFFTEKDDRMIPADRTILPVGDSDKLQFELPQIGLTLVVRDASGKVISKWTWNIDRARFELSK